MPCLKWKMSHLKPSNLRRYSQPPSKQTPVIRAIETSSMPQYEETRVATETLELLRGTDDPNEEAAYF